MVLKAGYNHLQTDKDSSLDRPCGEQDNKAEAVTTIRR